MADRSLKKMVKLLHVERMEAQNYSDVVVDFIPQNQRMSVAQYKISADIKSTLMRDNARGYKALLYTNLNSVHICPFAN